MTKQDAERIAEHCHAQVDSDQFMPRVRSAFETIRDIPEYQKMAAILIDAHGINFHTHSGSADMSPSQISALVLCAIAYGFAFGEDWGEGKTLESTLAGKGDGR